MNAAFPSLLGIAGRVLASLTGILIVTSRAQTVTQDFNVPGGGTFLSDWNQNGPNAPNFYQDAAGDGLGGSNAVALTSITKDATAIFRNTSFNLSVGTMVTISGYFLDQQIGASSDAAIGAFQIGFGSSAGDGSNDVHSGTAFNDMGGDSVDTAGNLTAITARVVGDGSIEFQTLVDGAEVNTPKTSAASLTAGNWYFLTATFTVSSTANTFSGTASLFNSDSNGNLGSVIESTSSAAMSNSVLWNDTAAYAGFRAAGQTSSANGVSLVDNFSASTVPEPGCALLLLGGGAFIALRRLKWPQCLSTTHPFSTHQTL